MLLADLLSCIGPCNPCRSPVPKKVANFPIGVWSGVFLLLSAADHLLVVLPRVNAVYNRYLCLNRNPFRWAEYSGACAAPSSQSPRSGT